MDIQEFYEEKRKSHARLVRELVAGKHPHQPELETVLSDEDDEEKKVPTSVYMTSVRKREAGTTSGSTVCMSIELAAYRMADGTHRVATGPEIVNYLQHQLDEKKRHDKMDASRELKRMQLVSDTQGVPTALEQAFKAATTPKDSAPAAKK